MLSLKRYLLNHIFQRRDADDFFESDMNGFAVGLNAVDAGFADVDFAGRGGVPKVVDVNAFQHERLVMNRMQTPQIDKWCLHIDHDLFSDEFFHRRSPVLNSVLNLVSESCQSGLSFLFLPHPP